MYAVLYIGSMHNIVPCRLKYLFNIIIIVVTGYSSNSSPVIYIVHDSTIKHSYITKCLVLHEKYFAISLKIIDKKYCQSNGITIFAYNYKPITTNIMETKISITAKELQEYCSKKFNKIWNIKECEEAINLAVRRGSEKRNEILREAINFLYC